MSHPAGDPWGRRRHPDAYDATELRRMLVNDYAWNRPLGGPMEVGAAFLIGACARIARLEGGTPEGVFQSILAEGQALTGREHVRLA